MWRRILLLLPLVLGPIAACTKWALSDQPLTALPDRGPGKGIGTLRLYLASGDPVVLSHAYLRHDSLVGLVEKSRSEEAFATADIRSVEIRKSDPLATSFAIVGGLAVALAAAGAIAVASMGPMFAGSSSGGGESTASCPIVYSWDGSQWLLDSGTFGGAITRGLQRTDVDGLDHLSPTGGVLKLRVTNELDETDHLDALELLVVDHSPGTRIVPDGTGTMSEKRSAGPR